jgi:hypothetical protein
MPEKDSSQTNDWVFDPSGSQAERARLHQNELRKLLTQPSSIVDIPTEYPRKEDLSANEWNMTMDVLRQVTGLIESSEAAEQGSADNRYDFDMGLAYTHFYAYQSEYDPNFTCTIRMQPVPEKVRDFAYDTEGKKLTPEQIQERDMRIQLRYQISPGSWVVCKFTFRTSSDYSVLAGNPVQTAQLEARKMSTDLSYLSVHKPLSMAFWLENLKPDSDLKELGLMITSPNDVLNAVEAARDNEDTARTVTGELNYYLNKLDDGTVVPELKQLVEEMQTVDELKSFAKSFLDRIGETSKYQFRFLPVTGKLLAGLLEILGQMLPKPVSKDDILPPGTLIDMSSEELKAYQARFGNEE